MPVDDIGSWAAVPGSFAAGCAATWAFANKWFVPQRIKAVEAEVALLRSEVKKLQEKADKWDAMNERLAQGRLAELDQ